ncbi:MAG TPA: hypothetical protein EYP02_02680 [Sulfurovum sp.]|nr:hypothetical protein [Sulfurovum sp.]
MILFYLVTSFTSATHIHMYDEKHIDDCQICVIVQVFSGDVPPKYEIDFSCEICTYLIETAINRLTIKISYLKGFFSQAPPSLSF